MEVPIEIRVLGPSLLREAVEALVDALPLAGHVTSAATADAAGGSAGGSGSRRGRRVARERERTAAQPVVVLVGPDWADRVLAYRRNTPRGTRPQAGEPRYVLVTDEQSVDFYRARRLAISAFIGDDETMDVLAQGIQAAAHNRSFCSPQLLPALINAVGQGVGGIDAGANGTGQAAPTEENRPELSIREHQVALHAARGMSNEQIAVYLKISVPTVKYHLQRAFRKLAIERRTQLYAFLPYLNEASEALLGPVPDGPEE